MNIETWNRRGFLGAAGAVGLLGANAVSATPEPPPETRRIRLTRYPPSIDVACLSPMWVAEELLHAEGFEEVVYEQARPTGAATIAAGGADLAMTDVLTLLPLLDEGKPLLALAGIHGGCYVLIGRLGLRTLHDLKGKAVAVSNSARQAFVSAMLTQVGLDPRNVTFVDSSDGVRLLVEGKVDAALTYPPDPQKLRACKFGVEIVNTATDRPWAQYFCCIATSHRDFVAKNPVATKRALRALAKAADICAADPERVARSHVDRGFYKDYEFSLQALRDIPYRVWRNYDSADSLRFYALRLHEAGLIKSSPQKLLAQGTDWRFIDQLKKELKA